MQEYNLIWLVIGTFMFYSLNVTGFRIKSFVLVDGSCIKSEPIDLVFWIPYCVSVIVFYFRPDIGQWLLLSLYSFLFLLLTFNTYKYTMWPNEKKIKGYNKYFEKSHHIIKPSERRLIPDTFHIALYLLMFINIITMILYIVNSQGV